jgi:hypothetical protein
MTTNTRRDELRLLINSRQPIITVETTEEERLEALLFEVATEMDVPLFRWSVTKGLSRFHGEAMYNSDAPEAALTNIAQVAGDGIFLLKDFSCYCENDKICRRLRELAEQFRSAKRSIVISAAKVELPEALHGDVTKFEFSLPTAEELAVGVKEVIREASARTMMATELGPDGAMLLARNLAGMPMEEALRTLRMCILGRRKLDEGLLAAVLDAKRQSLRKDGLLDTIKRDASFTEVAGMTKLREWVGKRKNAMTAEGRKFGLTAPKGVLITGVQGCGKSLAAKAIAGEWGYDLARLDAGALYDKFVGESERRLHRALEQAQQLAPMVLWIDEIEKGFASAGTSGDADAGLSQRLLATLLTWMQDREGGVFLAATSNNISALPPEMLRKGRFDEIFFVDLPAVNARARLFEIHLVKRGRDAASFDLAKLSAASEGFSGAEIEQAIASGLYTAFGLKRQLSTEILMDEIRGTQPLSVTRAEDVQAIREWARKRAVDAQ